VGVKTTVFLQDWEKKNGLVRDLTVSLAEQQATDAAKVMRGKQIRP
jgi:hypothetical protein